MESMNKPNKGENNFYKIDDKGQIELDLDFDQSPKKEQKPWKDRVTEDEFRDLMLKHKIGPALWDSVVIDDTDPENPKVVTVNGRPYKDWNDAHNLTDGSDNNPWARE